LIFDSFQRVAVVNYDEYRLREIPARDDSRVRRALFAAGRIFRDRLAGFPVLTFHLQLTL